MGPFEIEAGADFLARLHEERSPIPTALRRARAKAKDAQLDVDDGSAAWVACEIVALAFGRGDLAVAPPSVINVLLRLKPTERNRLLALDALKRLDAPMSEVRALIGEDLSRLLEDLRARLEATSSGPIPLPIAQRGDVIALGDPSNHSRFAVIQVIGAREVAVFKGTFDDDAAAIQALVTVTFQRTLAQTTRLRLSGRFLANVPLRPELRKRHVYGHESGTIGTYFLSTASGGLTHATWEEARDYPVFRWHGRAALVQLAKGERTVGSPRSPDEHEASTIAMHAAAWAQRRLGTTPGPFGAPERLESLAEWIRTSPHAYEGGILAYGRPREDEERRAYAYAAIVAIWRGTWPPTDWPTENVGPLPERPSSERYERALAIARRIAEVVITRDSELRMMWDQSPDGGAELRHYVERLRQALV